MEALSILSKTLISAIITSGGNSTRFGSNKLLEKLNEYTVIENTILKFIDLVDEIVIPAQKEVRDFVEKSSVCNNKIKFAPPGLTRQQSVYSGLKNVEKKGVVLIHDGARPFVEKQVILDSIKKAVEKKAAVAGYMSVDTVKEVQDGKVVKTLDRNRIFIAQTPQAFEYDLILKIHEKFKNINSFTDDASMAEAYGIEVYCVYSNKNNKKITTKEDLA